MFPVVKKSVNHGERGNRDCRGLVVSSGVRSLSVSYLLRVLTDYPRYLRLCAEGSRSIIWKYSDDTPRVIDRPSEIPATIC